MEVVSKLIEQVKQFPTLFNDGRFTANVIAVHGSGTPSSLQIFRARLFGISVCRGTASICPVCGFDQSSCSLP